MRALCDNTFSHKAGSIWETVNHSVWYNASSVRTFPEVANWHHLGVKPPAGGKGACFLHTESSTQFRTNYSVQLQTIVYRSTGKRQTVALLGFLFRFRCIDTAFLPYITSPYLEGSSHLQASIDVREGGMERTTSPRIFLLLPCPWWTSIATCLPVNPMHIRIFLFRVMWHVVSKWSLMTANSAMPTNEYLFAAFISPYT